MSCAGRLLAMVILAGGVTTSGCDRAANGLDGDARALVSALQELDLERVQHVLATTEERRAAFGESSTLDFYGMSLPREDWINEYSEKEIRAYLTTGIVGKREKVRFVVQRSRDSGGAAELWIFGDDSDGGSLFLGAVGAAVVGKRWVFFNLPEYPVAGDGENPYNLGPPELKHVLDLEHQGSSLIYVDDPWCNPMAKLDAKQEAVRAEHEYPARELGRSPDKRFLAVRYEKHDPDSYDGASYAVFDLKRPPYEQALRHYVVRRQRI